MSLKVKLYQTIKDNGYLSYKDMCGMVAEEGYKISTSERRLRELMSAENSKIKPVMGKSKKGTPYIKAYKWEEPEPRFEPYKPVAREQVKLI